MSDTGRHKLDLVITHYMSPWSLGKPWFDMIALQRGMDFSQIGVILINDGEESRMEDDLFKDYPYEVRNITIPHGGVPVSRNAGLDAADSDWVMICDFDDTFLSVHSLSILLRAIDRTDKVMLVSDFEIEIPNATGGMDYQMSSDDMILLHGKLYRTDWLRENGIRFHDKLPLHEDVYFNTLARAVAGNRCGKLSGCYYLWCWNKDSVSRNIKRWELETYPDHIRQRLLINQEFLKRDFGDALEHNVVTTIVEGFYEFQQLDWIGEGLEEKVKLAERWFSTFLYCTMELFNRVDPKKIAAVIASVRERKVKSGKFLVERITFRDFMRHMMQEVRPIPPEERDL